MKNNYSTQNEKNSSLNDLSLSSEVNRISLSSVAEISTVESRRGANFQIKPITTFLATLILFFGMIGNGWGQYTRSTTTYSWEQTSPTAISSTSADEGTFALTIPFTFNFYGTDYTACTANVNGFINFGTTTSSATNVCIPNASTPNNFVAAYWDDLYFDYGCSPTYFYYETIGTAPNRKFIVSWIAFRAFGGSCGTYVYSQIKLFEGTNNIEVHLQSNALGSTGTIGIENSGGTVGDQAICNSATTNGTAWKWSLPMYRSNVASGNWGTASSWQKSSDGGATWATATTAPSSADGTITIQNGHNISVAASVTVDQLTVASGGTLTVASAQILTIANGSGTDVTVNGTLSNSGTITQNTSSTMTVAGTYTHNQNAGTIPIATWSSGSTCNITGQTSGTIPVNSNNQAFHHWTWNCPSQGTGAATLALASGTTMSVAGNFTVGNTGTSGYLALTGTGAPTLTVGGNLAVSGGILDLKTGNAGALVLNIAGNFSQSGGVLKCTATSSGTAKIVFNNASSIQTFTQSAGTISGTISLDVGTGSTANTLQLGSAVNLGTGTGVLRVLGGSGLDFIGFALTGSFTTTLNGQGPSNNGALQNTSSTGVTFASLITLGSASRINGGTGAITISNVGTMTGATFALTLAGGVGGTINSIIGNTSGGVIKNGNGTWQLNPSTSNTYTGTTKINAGSIVLGGADKIAVSNFELSGGTFSTGASTGYNETVGTLLLTASSNINLGSGAHTLTFAASNAVTWTAATTLTINGWTGTAGATGSGGKIFVGSTSGGLTASQLAQITFTGYGAATILSTGEVVPAAACTAPTTQASAITASSITVNSASINWTNGNGVGRVVYINTTNSFTAPTNGTNPTANTSYSSGQQCIFNGTGSGPVSLTNLASGTTYWVRVYEFCNPSRNYQTSTETNNPTSFTTTALLGENCSNAQDLSTLISPFSGTTVGYANDISTCNTGAPDRIFYIDVPNNSTITFQETANNYDEYEYIGYGSTCPGTTQIQCWDNDGLAATAWTNTTGSTQRVWYVQDGLSGGFGTFTLTWSLTTPLPGDNCTNAQDLSALTSPFSGTTVGYANDISTCITGAPDRIFYIDVPNNSTITFQETTNNYDEYEYIGYGSTCPGTTQIQCWDNDGLAATAWTNTTGSTQRVWYVQDGLSGGFGTFTLTWSITSPCTAPTTQASNITVGSITSSSASVNWTNGNGAGRVVYINTTNNFTAPTNGTNPTANTSYTSGQQCIFNGTGSGPVSLTNLASSTTYWVHVYEYCESTRTYQTAIGTNNPNSFTTSANLGPCSSITNIASCGTSTSFSISSGNGSYNPPSTTCGYSTPGLEKIYSFTPSATGSYTIVQTSSTNFIDWFYRTASSGCSGTGWTCIDDLTGSSTSVSFSLTAGVEYYFLADPEVNTGDNVTFSIGCPLLPPTSANCSSPGVINASWTPASTGPTAYLYYVQIDQNPTFSGTWGAGSGLQYVYSPSTSYTWSGAAPNTTYYVHVASVSSSWAYDGVTNSSGCTTPAAAVNDLCANATTLTVSAPTANFSFTGAYPSNGGYADASYPDKWYKFTPSCTGTFQIALTNSSFDADIYLYSDCASMTNLLTGGSTSANNETGSANLTSGQTYYLRVVDYALQYSTFSLQVTITSTPTTPTTITFTGTEPTCQLTSAGNTTDYNSTVTVGTLSWSLTGITNTAGTLLASAINSSTGVVTWPNGWAGSVTINVESTGCNGPSTATTRVVTVNPTVATPTTITFTGTEPTCQLTSAGNTTDYNSTVTVGTLSWSLTGITNTAGTLLASAINSSTGVVTWPNGWAGSVTINLVSTGCNGPSTATTRTVTVNPTVATPTTITFTGTEPTCQLTSAGNTTDYNSTVTVGTLSWSLTGITNTAGTLLASAINSSTGVVTWPNGWAGSVTINLVSAGCNGPSTATTRTVTVNSTFSAGAINTTGESFCSGGDPVNITSSSAASGGDASITYKWQANGVDISNSNNTSYDPPSGLSTTTTYTRWAKDGTCNTTFSQSTGTWTVTVNQPTINVTVNNSSIGNGDYLWNGNTSTDGSVASNWYVLNNGVYSVASQAPTTSTEVFIINFNDASTCVSSTNNANIPASGSFSSGNIYVGSNASMSLGSNSTLNVTGNFINDGSFNSGTGTVSMNGSTAQSIGGSAATTFNNLTINNASGVALEKSANIDGTLTLTNGRLSLGSNNLTLGTSATISGSPSASNMIVAASTGELRKRFSSAVSNQPAFTFPVGTVAGGNEYSPVILDFNSGTFGSSAYVGVRVQNARNSFMNTGVNTYINRNWIVEPNDITDFNYNITLDYADNDFVQGSGDYTINDILPVKYSGDQWYQPDGFTVFTNTIIQGQYNPLASGFMQWDGLTTFSEFGGAAGNNQPLPVELVSFSGACEEGVINLTWQTTSEFNSSHFDVEKSRDGENWQVLTTLPSAGTSNELITYQSTDQNGTEGNNYFRLRQVDIDGKEKLYDPINISCSEVTTGYFSSFPNPSGSAFQVIVNNKELIGTCTMNIVDAQGKVIEQREIDVKDGINMFVINQELTPGIYFLNITNGSKSTPVIRHAIK